MGNRHSFIQLQTMFAIMDHVPFINWLLSLIRLRVQLAPNWNRWWWIGWARWSAYPPSSCTLAATAWVEESSKYFRYCCCLLLFSAHSQEDELIYFLLNWAIDDSKRIDVRSPVGRTDGSHKTLQDPISWSGRRWNQQPSSRLLLWPGKK